MTISLVGLLVLISFTILCITIAAIAVISFSHSCNQRDKDLDLKRANKVVNTVLDAAIYALQKNIEKKKAEKNHPTPEDIKKVDDEIEKLFEEMRKHGPVQKEEDSGESD